MYVHRKKEDKRINTVETKEWFLRMNINIFFSFLHDFEKC